MPTLNEVYLDIHVAVPPDERSREILPAALGDLGFEGFLEDDRGIHCFIRKSSWTGSMETILKDISGQFRLSFVEYLSTTEITNRNWNEEWERSIRPIAVTDRIVITPSWHPVEAKDSLVLTIDPKMTFGTGYHESTRIMLRLMERFVTPGCTVLDVGTGTGILAIAAVKLGASHAVGVDIDEWTLENGMENVRRNNVDGQVDIRIGSLEAVPEPSFQIILANIIRNTILELMDGILAKTGPNGTILFSGLLTTDRSFIESSLNDRGFAVTEMMQENEWIGLAVQRR